MQWMQSALDHGVEHRSTENLRLSFFSEKNEWLVIKIIFMCDDGQTTIAPANFGTTLDH